MTDEPRAYHIIFGTYGMRLHGDERGTVDRRMNHPSQPIIGHDPDWQRMERRLLRFSPVHLVRIQRAAAEIAIPRICERGGWKLHVAAVHEDHVHVLLSASADGDAVQKWFKRWLGEALSQRWPLPSEQSWWARSGCVRWVWTQTYFDNVFGYIWRQRTFPLDQHPLN